MRDGLSDKVEAGNVPGKAPGEVSDRIKAIRRELGMSQAEFAKPLGCTGASVSEMEKGKYKPNFEFVCRIDQVYGVNVYYLLFGEGEMFGKGSRPQRALPDEGSNELKGGNSGRGILFPESSIRVSMKDFSEFMEYLQGSSMVQYSVLAYFGLLLSKEKDVIMEQMGEFRKKRKGGNEKVK